MSLDKSLVIVAIVLGIAHISIASYRDLPSSVSEGGSKTELSSIVQMTGSDQKQLSLHGSDLSSQSLTALLTSQSGSENTICERACQEQIVNRLGDIKNLSTVEIRNIQQNPGAFAELLVQYPEGLGHLLLALDDEDYTRVQLAAQSVLEAMFPEDLKTVVAVLLNHADANFRTAGLNSFEHLDLQDETNLSMFDDLVFSESNAGVLLQAINIVADPDTDNKLVPALDIMLSRYDSELVWGTALLAKTRLVPKDEQIKLDISEALTNSSFEIRHYALQALSVLSEHHTITETGEIYNPDPVLAAHLDDIVYDLDMDRDAVELALRLLQ